MIYAYKETFPVLTASTISPYCFTKLYFMSSRLDGRWPVLKMRTGINATMIRRIFAVYALLQVNAAWERDVLALLKSSANIASSPA
jgi:hypothetical protein